MKRIDFMSNHVLALVLALVIIDALGIATGLLLRGGVRPEQLVAAFILLLFFSIAIWIYQAIIRGGK